MELSRPRRPLLTYGTYPLLVLVTAAGIWAAIGRGADRNAAVGILTAITIAVVFIVERVNPLLDRWQMTAETLVRRDLPFIGLAVVVEQLATMAVALVAAATIPAEGFGPLHRLPLIVQALVAILALDLLWYAYHRTAHTVGALWRIHSVHHAPAQLYVLVHQVFHPIDLLVSRFVISLIVFRLSGIGPDAAFISIVLLGLQQTVSHVNSDLRLGWLNYLVIGPETHRYHHAAGARGNFSSVIPLWDLLLRTFVYDPARIPGRLGLDDPSRYPDPRDFHATLIWPLRPARSRAALGRAGR